jgi:hypothetical protein
MWLETAFCFAHLLFFITGYARRVSLILWRRVATVSIPAAPTTPRNLSVRSGV